MRDFKYRNQYLLYDIFRISIKLDIFNMSFINSLHHNFGYMREELEIKK